jgi:glycosyltransferase involved in cell wall biosynthesis
MKPCATVIISTYNWSSVLPYAIDSVLNQTLSDFELLVIGDGCTDDTEQVVMAIKDPRVRWINLPVNTGHQSAPNNRGIQEARGEFIAYLGHDDLWLKHHLDCSISKLIESGADIAHTLLLQIPPGRDVGLPVLPKPALKHGAPPSCRVHRRQVTDEIGGWKDYRSLSIAPETDFFFRAHGAGFRAIFVPRLTAIKFPASRRKNVYLVRPNNEQAAWSRRIKSEPDFEVANLVRTIEALAQEIPREMPISKLVRTFLEELAKRTVARLRRAKGGREIERYKTFKGV